MKSINDRMAVLRKALGLSQEEFGRNIAIVKSGISNMEKSVRNINERTIKLICQQYNVNEAWLRTGEGEMFNEFSNDLEEIFMTHAPLLDEMDRKIIIEYLKLTPEHKSILKDFIRRIAE